MLSEVGVTMHTCEWEKPSCDYDVFLKGMMLPSPISTLALVFCSYDNSSLLR